MSEEKKLLLALKQLDIGDTLMFEVSGKSLQAAMNGITAYEKIVGVKVSQESGVLIMGNKSYPIATTVLKVTLIERDPDFKPDRPERKTGPSGPQYISKKEATEKCKQRIAKAIAMRDAYWMAKRSTK